MRRTSTGKADGPSDPVRSCPRCPFLALGLAPLWDRWRTAGRVVLAGGWIWGAALTLIAVSTTPQPPASIMRPVTELMVPAFLEGHLALNNQRFTDLRGDEYAIWRHADPTVSWNLGMPMGLTGRASLVPLGIVWLVCGAWLVSARPPQRRRGGTENDRPRAGLAELATGAGPSSVCLIVAKNVSAIR